MNKNARRPFDIILNVLIVLLLIWALSSPTSPLRTAVASFGQQWAERSLVNGLWGELVSEANTALYGNSPDTVIAFMDYQCRACASANAYIFETSTHDVTLLYRHFPLTGIHPNAEGAARTALCGAEQGYFREVNAGLYESSDWHDHPDWLEFAREVGLPDISEFESCLSAERTRARLRADRQLANELGLNATPTFVFRSGIEVGFTASGRWGKLSRETQ